MQKFCYAIKSYLHLILIKFQYKTPISLLIKNHLSLIIILSLSSCCLAKGSLHGCTVPFQKLAPIPNPNQPGVWH